MFAKTLFALATLALAAAAPVQQQEEKRATTYTGQATYFEVGLGACGWWNGNNDMIVALNQGQYQAGNGAACGNWIEITNKQNGWKNYAYVADECPGCEWGSLDMSPQLFGELSNWNYDEGVFQIEWSFIDGKPDSK